jgi:hypothetical protein
VQRWNLPEGWVISKHPAHAALVSEADFIAAQDAGRPAAAAGEGMTGAISVPVTAASRGGRRDQSAQEGGRSHQPGRPRVQAVL